MFWNKKKPTHYKENTNKEVTEKYEQYIPIFKKRSNDDEVRKFYNEHNLIIQKDVYYELFESNIKGNGTDFYNNLHGIKEYSIDDNVYTCVAHGTFDYNVVIKFGNDKHDKIDSCSCTCPYYRENEKNCKHIFAFLKKIYSEENFVKISHIIEENIPLVDTLIKSIEDKGINIEKFVRYYEKIKNNYKNYHGEVSAYCDCYDLLDIKRKLERINNGSTIKQVELEDAIVKPIKRNSGTKIVKL